MRLTHSHIKGVLAIAMACTLIYLAGGLALDGHINSAIDPLRSDTKGVQAILDASKPFVAPKVLKKGTSLSPGQLGNAVWKRAEARGRHVEDLVPSDIKDFSEATLAFFAVAYSCARYAVRIEHPLQWYRATRMKNYTKDD
jgi:hypothetical protein